MSGEGEGDTACGGKGTSMQTLYFVLAAVHIVAIVVTGILWTIIDIGHPTGLRRQLRDVRAVHFGSLYLVPWFLGLSWAFDRLQVPWPSGASVVMVSATRHRITHTT